jgi:hypothetical protein
MAGAGYKLFDAYDVLTAAQVNTYLMQQTVMVFANSAARTSALSSVLAEGMVSYLQDTNTLEVYDGTAWVGATGDITALTASTGISITSPTGPVPTVAIDTAVVPQLATANTFTGGVQQITTASAASVGLIVRGLASQTANLQEWQDSAGAVLSRIQTNGRLVTDSVLANYLQGDPATGAFIDFENYGNGIGLVGRTSAAANMFVIRGMASQTGNLQEWQNSAGTVLSLVDSAGQLRAPNIGIGGTSVGIAYVRFSNATGDTGATTAVFRGLASQTGDFLRFQNSTPTTLTAITSAGTINFASGNTSATANTGAVTLPALAVGFITMQVAGTTVKVPYYAN